MTLTTVDCILILVDDEGRDVFAPAVVVDDEPDFDDGDPRVDDDDDPDPLFEDYPGQYIGRDVLVADDVAFLRTGDWR
jgi:hypothetical protein